MKISPVVAELGALFSSAGQELYLVGGSVRDALLGELGQDLDFTTSARPDEIERLLRRFTRSVWDIGKDYGTISASKHVDGADWIIEITTFRADTYRSDSRKPEVRFGDSLTADLVRRDFSVNAMAINVATNEFVDPHHGLDDLAAGLLRTPAAAQQSFSDDPLRMMRACRFASKLGFEPVPEVLDAIRDMAERITMISAERVRDELSRLLLTDNPAKGLDLMVGSGLADLVLPELPALRLEADEHHRHKDVYQHSLTVLDQAIALEKSRGHAADLVNRLAALLHDIGKPATRELHDGGTVSFHHHDIVGAKLCRRRLRALKYPNDVVKAVSKLVELHLRFHGYGEGSWSDAAVRRYVRDAGDQLEQLHMLTRSDCTTRNQRKATRLRRAYDDIEHRIERLTQEEELSAMRPELDGTQIMELLQIPPGPAVGQAYEYLLNRRIEEGLRGEDTATADLMTWWATQQR